MWWKESEETYKTKALAEVPADSERPGVAGAGAGQRGKRITAARRTWTGMFGSRLKRFRRDRKMYSLFFLLWHIINDHKFLTEIVFKPISNTFL